MSNNTLNLTPEVYDYLQKISLREPEVLSYQGRKKRWKSGFIRGIARFLQLWLCRQRVGLLLVILIKNGRLSLRGIGKWLESWKKLICGGRLR